MTFTAVKLVNPLDGTQCIIMPRDGVSVMSLDVQPTVRTVTEERVNAHGQVDNTLYLSTASVTMDLRLWTNDIGTQTAEDFDDEINLFLNPSLRPNLVVSNDQWSTDRQLSVRFDSKTALFDNPMTQDVQIAWKAPAGVWQAPVPTVVIANSYIAATGGLVMTNNGLADTVSGVQVIAGSSTGNPSIIGGGNMTVPFTAKLYGPCTGPKFTNDTVGLDIVFTDSLVLGAGVYVEINSLNHTALRNSDPNDSVLGLLNFSSSTWWQFQPGNNTVRYHPTSASAGAVAQITYQTAWMT